MSQSAASSVIEQIRALEKRKVELLEAGKAEALKKAHEAIAELAELGLFFRLVEESGAPAPRAAAANPTSKRRSAEGPCPICGFKTNPPHDGRSHRGQSPKAPFKADELRTRGLAKAD